MPFYVTSARERKEDLWLELNVLPDCVWLLLQWNASPPGMGFVTGRLRIPPLCCRFSKNHCRYSHIELSSPPPSAEHSIPSIGHYRIITTEDHLQVCLVWQHLLQLHLLQCLAQRHLVQLHCRLLLVQHCLIQLQLHCRLLLVQHCLIQLNHQLLLVQQRLIQLNDQLHLVQQHQLQLHDQLLLVQQRLVQLNLKLLPVH